MIFRLELQLNYSHLTQLHSLLPRTTLSAGVTCSVLEPPESGRVSLTGTRVGDSATYSCLPGFELQGVERRTCQSNGEWAYEAPSCVGEL